MERKIGEIFEYNGEWYQCVEGTGCGKCDLRNIICQRDTSIFPFKECSGNFRTDKKSVVFKKLEKVGEPYEYLDEKVIIEIKQNQENMEDNKKQTSLNSTKDIYEKFKGKTVQCLVNNKEGDLVNGYGIVCGYKDKYLIIGFTNEYEGCIKSFTDNVFLENRDFLSYRFWNISHVDDKSFIKPFNLEAAKAGKPVCTRDGRNARILAFDLKNNVCPIVAAVEENNMEVLYHYDTKGLNCYKKSKIDLMMLSEKKEGWINICRNLNTNKTELDTKDIYNTKKEALQNLSSMTYVTTVKIEWEE